MNTNEFNLDMIVCSLFIVIAEDRPCPLSGGAGQVRGIRYRIAITIFVSDYLFVAERAECAGKFRENERG
jgi:hypothetical protein